MRNNKTEKSSEWPEGFEQHKAEQILRQARESTPAQRLHFVEDALRFLHSAGCSYLERKKLR